MILDQKKGELERMKVVLLVERVEEQEVQVGQEVQLGQEVQVGQEVQEEQGISEVLLAEKRQELRQQK